MLKQLVRESSLLAPDFRSFRRQELTFVSLNLFLLSALLAVHVLFPSYFGTPPLALKLVLATGLLANGVEGAWLQRSEALSAQGIVALTWATIALNMAISFALATLSFRQDIQYFALMIAPILQAAFRLSLRATAVAVVASASLIFFWVWNFFRLHPPTDLNEYLEAGTIAAIYAAAGLLVWTLVNHLRSKELELSKSLTQLEQTKERLLIEEKLAAVGRFSAAIAHEIRNPVAMISSALMTGFARSPESAESKEMFEIAAREASRLEKLTTSFLAYARPSIPSKERSDVALSVGYVAEICRPRAAEMAVSIHADSPEGLWAEIDGGQLQQALMNLTINAVEASAAGDSVALRASRRNGQIRIEIENGHGPIPPKALDCMFEPFFTTKPTGTGLGLAIAHNIIRGLGGDLVLTRNEPDLVQFSVLLPSHEAEQQPA